MTLARLTLILAIAGGLAGLPATALGAKGNARTGDRDGDGLTDRFELRRSQTSPRRADTDRDGLSDGREVRRLRSDPLDPASPRSASTPAPSRPQPKAPEAPKPPPPPPPWAPPPPPPPPPPPAPPPPPSSEPCAVTAASAAQLRTAVAGNPGQVVCVQGDLGPVDLNGVRPSSAVTVRPSPAGGGSVGWVQLVGAQRITIDGLRLAGAELRDQSRNLTFRNCVAGGTPTSRLTSLAVFDIRQHSYDVTISGCEIAYTGQTQPSDAGYGIRAVNGNGGPIDNLIVEKTHLHHLNCDALQLAGADVTLDRSEISYIASLPPYDCHADSIQVMSVTAESRFTNNWIHHVGYTAPGQAPGAAGQWIWHPWGPGALVENNLLTDNRNYAISWNAALSNLTVRNNTILRGGTAFGSGACSGTWNGLDAGDSYGTSRLAEGNIIDRRCFGGPVTETGNVWVGQSGSGSNLGSFSAAFDANMNPTNLPPSHAGAGYRKPSGVHW